MPPRTISHEPASERAPSPPPTFVALDFETADYGRDSACALALVRTWQLVAARCGLRLATK